MQNYEEVPTIITGKDLDYLSDIFNWNFNASKLTYSFLDKVTDEEIKNLFNKVINVHNEHAKAIINILR